MDLFVASFSILALAYAWSKIWSKTVLDDTRDRLFDLRDESREWFLKNGYTLDNRVYISLRKLLNSHIRHTESLSFTRYIAVIKMLCTDKEFREYIDGHIQASFWTEDEAISRYVSGVRAKAAATIERHIITGSFSLMAIGVTLTPFFAAYSIVRSALMLFYDNRYALFGVNKKAAIAAIAFSLMFLPWRVITTSQYVARYFTQQQIECYTAN